MMMRQLSPPLSSERQPFSRHCLSAAHELPPMMS